MPDNVYELLFAAYPHQIDEVQPMVPHLWVGKPGSGALTDVETAYPSIETVRAGIENVLDVIAKEKDVPLVTRENRDVNPKPIEDLLQALPKDFRFDLTRDYNGEYAPCIAAALCKGRCYVVASQKPANIKRTIQEVSQKKNKKKVDLTKCPKDFNKALRWLEDWIRKKSGFNSEYHECEREKAELTGHSLFDPIRDYGIFVTDKAPKGNPVSMNSLHQGWLFNEIPKAFAETVEGWILAAITTEQSGEKPKQRRWLAELWAQQFNLAAPKVKRKPGKNTKSESKDLDVSLQKKNTVKKKAPRLTFFIWVRHQPPKGHSHNMAADLLFEIVTGTSLVCRHLADIGEVDLDTVFRFILFGDRPEGDTVSILPVHATKPDKAVMGAVDRIGKAGKATIPEFVADLFQDPWDNKPAVEVIDLRNLYSAKAFTVPTLATLAKQNWKLKNVLKTAKQFVKQSDNHRQRNLSYWEQYGLFAALRDAVTPRFMIGAESGNMDGFGYCGIPVVSVDVVDPIGDLDHSVLTDRIGQYALLTPLWDLLNYERGANLALFRGHLYGCVLKYVRYGGRLPQKPGKARKVKAGTGDLKAYSELSALLGSDTAFDLEVDAVEEELTAHYGVVDVRGDGNCLFRALSRSRTPTEENHALYRQRAVDYAAANYTLVTLRAGHEQWNDAQAYRTTMRVPAANAQDLRRYGGYVEAVAFAARFDVTVEVYSQGQPDNPQIANAGRPEVVRVYYVNSNHYKALVPLPDND